MRRAIVTGATGAIGIALVQVLLENQIEVLVIVNPDSKRLDRLPESKQLHMIKCSLDNFQSLSEEQLGNCDMFFHLAWMGTIGSGRDDLYLQMENVRYTLDAVNLAHRVGCEVFVGAGSQAEYGRVEGKLSGDTKTEPEMGYGVAKLCAGQMSRLECRKYGIRHIWTRILSVYGPYDGEKTMIISGIRQMLRGEIPPFSKGEQQWDYLYSGDAGRALYLSAAYGKDGKIYPIGSGEVHPLHEYIESMRNHVGKDAKAGIGQLPYREQQVMYLCANIKELQEDTGFKPMVSFEEGIEKTIAWCKRTE